MTALLSDLAFLAGVKAVLYTAIAVAFVAFLWMLWSSGGPS